MNIKNRILSEADKDYKNFSQSLIPNIDNVLGVRLPVLRKIAKEIYAKGNWQGFLKQTDFEYMEETMLQAMVIGLIKDEPEKILELVKDFVPKIDNWSVCDCFCTGLKFAKKNPDLVWDFIQPYFSSKAEYDVRFAYVMLLEYFVEAAYIDGCLKLIDEFKDARYYAQMACAWALSVCYIKFPQKTLLYLKSSKLDNWTFNKGVQKICESLRVDETTKTMLKSLKRR